MKFSTLAHIAAVLRGGPSKLKAMYRKPAVDEAPIANGTENGVLPPPETEPKPTNGSADKGKAKEPAAAAVAPPASVPAAPVVAREPETPKKGKAGRRAATDPGSSPAASSSRTVIPPSATRPSSPNASVAIFSSSGPSPQSHPALLPPVRPAAPPVAGASTSVDKDTATTVQDSIERRAIIEQREVFICDAAGGVNSQRLLTLTRRELLSRGESYGGNALIDEHWTVSIGRSKRLSIGGRSPRIRVTIVYSATAARTPHGTDPQLPVALFQAKGIPGLMTVLERL